MKRKILYGLLFVVLVLLTVYLLKFQKEENLTQENNSIKVGYNIGNVNFAPFFIAYVEDFFSNYNVQVDIVPLSSSGEVNLALSSGQIDLALTGVTDLFIPISKNIPVKIIAPMASAPLYLYVRPNSGIETFQDLLGKTIAARPGGAVDYGIRYFLTKENIDTSKVNFINIDKVYRPIALMEKDMVDAVPIGGDELATYIKAGAVLHQEWKQKGYHNLNRPENVIAANEDFISSNQALIGKFLDAIIDGHKFIKANPDESAQIVSSYIQEDTESAVILQADDIVNLWKDNVLKYDLWYDPANIVDMSNIALEIGQIQSSLNLNQIFDFRFENKLENAQNEIYPIN